jgi:rRNA processing protein Krr1/Pno1
MQTFYINKISEVIKNKSEIERKLGIKLLISGKQVTIDSQDGMQEYEASSVMEALQFGFSTARALLLTDPEVIFRVLRIKDFT